MYRYKKTNHVFWIHFLGLFMTLQNAQKEVMNVVLNGLIAEWKYPVGRALAMENGSVISVYELY